MTEQKAEIDGVKENEYGEPGLTKQQDNVVDHVCDSDDTVTAVDASAGTGKTFVLVRAILKLIYIAWDRDVHLDVDQFILITFTNKAADELEKALYDALLNRRANAPQQEKDLWARQLERVSGAFIGTIHSFCKKEILRPFGYDQGVAREAGVTFAGQLLDEAVRDVMEAYDAGRIDEWIDDGVSEHERIREVLNSAPDVPLFDAEGALPQHEFDERLKKAMELIHNRGWSTGEVLRWTCENQPEDNGYPYRSLFAALVRVTDLVYREKKSEDQVLDNYDLLYRAVQLLEDEREGVNVGHHLGRRFQYLFIDEFQDTDQLQKRIVDSLVEHLDGILVVGDWKQSIYRFRGAEPQLLEDIAEEHMTANGGNPFPLTVSGRPSEQLRKAINRLFRSVGERFAGLDVELEEWVTRWEADDEIPEVIVRGTGQDDLEARLDATSNAISDLLGQEWQGRKERRTVHSGDVVVLCRTNDEVETYVQGLSARGLDARSEQGKAFYARPEIVSTYRMLRLVLNQGDDAALAAALSTPYLRDVDLKEYEHDLIQYDIEGGNFLVDKLRRDHPEILGPSAGENSSPGKLDRLRKSVRTDTAAQVLDQLYDEFGILDYYEEEGNTAAVQNLQRLREIARTLMQDDQALTLRLFTDYLRRAGEVRQEEDKVEPEDEDRQVSHVRVMTVHQAKGLEFPFVVIPEIQRDLVRSWNLPSMILTEDHGLDVSVLDANRDEQGTRSNRFREILNSNRAGDVKEEMRVFYVAVTRAQHSVLLIGDDECDPRDVPNDAFEGESLSDVNQYSWQDEVLRARSTLEDLANSTENQVSVDFQV